MEETVKTAVEAIESADTLENSVEQYLGLPKAVRREVYAELKDGDLKKKVRAAVEKRRGIAMRTADGVLVLSREAIKEQIARLVEKQTLMDARKATLGERVVELTKQAQEMYGDDFVKEVEAGLKVN